MTLVDQINALVTAVGADIKTLFTAKLPIGGAVGDVLTKSAVTDYAAVWQAPVVQAAPIIAKMAATQAFSAVAFANITSLFGAMVANAVYEVEAFVTFQSAATTTGLGLGFTAPAGAYCGLEITVPIVSAAAASALRTTFPNAAATNTGNVLGTGVTATASNHTAHIRGIVICGVTAGNLQLTAASEVAASAVTLQIGSILMMKKIA